jgi:hypothetical protein
MLDSSGVEGPTLLCGVGHFTARLRLVTDVRKALIAERGGGQLLDLGELKVG